MPDIIRLYADMGRKHAEFMCDNLTHDQAFMQSS